MKELLNTKHDVARELARKYSTMTLDELSLLESILVPMKFSRGQLVLKEGEVCHYIYYVDRGLVRLFYFKNDKELTEHLQVEGNIVMSIESLFKERPTKLQIEAIENSIIYGLPRQSLEEIALHNGNIQILYRKILEESLIQSQVHADMLRFETAQDRYKKLCKMQPQIVLRAPMNYIASYLQMTPETLSRVRNSTLLDD
ncbi:Crp/Fnr family transcriptional regulator [Xylanibacter oryzae]|jgi:CRP-like cAMP-binding protein|uniref:Crp/Fnr family transcriptional regulator n=1 Tax=Xylanibacter oryzae TaxID=185293 RepID=UPI0004B07BB4|nr:Crp/Fnr family transcriptional regulator [Xylanibacter oryzae]MBP7358756.1 Crp/Fnr family transcriptional regulator [Prevotella sp.]